MKKYLFFVCCLLLATGSMAEKPALGFGVNAGLIYPIIQDDQDNGSMFGLKAMYSLMNMVTVEPNITFVKYGEPSTSDPELAGLYDGFEGSKVTSYGIDGILGGRFGARGISPYGIFGFGFYNMKREMTDQDVTDFGWTGGLGIEIGMSTSFAVDVRGKVNVVPSDGGGSKKSLSATAGVNFYLGK